MKNTNSILIQSAAALLLLSLAACSSGGGTAPPASTAPTVVSNVPLGQAIDVPVNSSLSATFSELMEPSTLNTTTFTLTREPGSIPVQGTVLYANSTAVFWPTEHLEDNSAYTATITVGATDTSGEPLSVEHTWGFSSGDSMGPGQSVDLGRSGSYAILAKAAISTVPTSAITGNLGLSPAAATFITGFALTLDPSNVFATSTQVTGQVFAADYAPPTPVNLTSAVLDMQTAFTDAAGRAPDVTELGAGNIGGMTLAPGVYKWGTGLLIPTALTLDGSDSAVWIFQIAQDLNLSSATSVVLTGGALAKNVFWQVTGLVDIGTTAHLEGVVLCATAITLETGSSVHGRLLAQTAVSLDGSTVVEPAP
jgi:Ice-binding-like/Bacterial Ig-like domain